jgi:CheY-like chemotaxis protein
MFVLQYNTLYSSKRLCALCVLTGYIADCRGNVGIVKKGLNKMQSISVLIVDYDKQYATVTKQCLELQGGLTVENAFTANEAVEKSKKLNPDVIVISIPPEKMSFIKTLRSLKQAGFDQPIIAFAIDVKEQIRSCPIKVEGCVEKFGDPAAVYGQLKRTITDLASVVEVQVLDNIVVYTV